MTHGTPFHQKDYPPQNTLVDSFSRIQVRLYTTGLRPPELKIIETYLPRKRDGVQEMGGRDICEVPINEPQDVSRFASVFREEVEASGLLSSESGYVESSDTRAQILKAAQRSLDTIFH